MCDYTTNYFDLTKEKYVSYQCPHKAMPKKDPSGESFCIFHSTSEKKNTDDFTKELLKLYKTGEHLFVGFVFPADFSFPDFTREAEGDGVLTFINAAFSKATFLCPVQLSGARFTGEGGANFIEAAFLSDGGVNFSGAHFTGDGGANFRMGRFEGTGAVNFSRTEFTGSGRVDFTWAKFTAEGGADFKLADFSGAVIVDFHFAEFDGKGIHFNGTRFLGDGGANFSLVQFRGGGVADFGGAKFQGAGEANFSLSTFSARSGVNFSKANFSCDGGVNFSMAQFTSKAKNDFSGMVVEGSGQANFSKAQFLGDGAVFFKNPDFACQGGVSFSGSQFSGTGRTVFEGRIFWPGVWGEFTDILFEHPHRVTFERVDLGRCRFLRTNLQGIHFVDVTWNGRSYGSSYAPGRMKLFDELFQHRGRFVRHLAGFIQGIPIWDGIRRALERVMPEYSVDNQILSSPVKRGLFRLRNRLLVLTAPKEDNHWDVYGLYNQMGQNYISAHRYHDAGDFFAGSLEMRRREAGEKPWSRIVLRLYRLFCLYGERPFRALLWAAAVVALFGLVFLKIGIAPEGVDPITYPNNITAEIVEGPDNRSIIVLNPMAEPVPSYLPGGMIKYEGFGNGVLFLDGFLGDYSAGVSVVFSLFFNRVINHSYSVIDPVLGSFALTCEILLLLMFLGLFLASFIRKYRMSGR
ncbi:MAG: pentapeptide repeat-containing protein [Deltaproteobacteria bacterium]|nr:pentapeptide repeat-containing protein [Candidatus Zymogenaceae bacterium]